MNYKLLIDPLSKKDILEIYNYAAINDSAEKAKKLLENLEETYLKLEKLPERGHIPLPCSARIRERLCPLHKPLLSGDRR